MQNGFDSLKFKQGVTSSYDIINIHKQNYECSSNFLDE